MEDIDRQWRKSSYSGNGGECVEVADRDSRVLVRDTKQDEAGPVLQFSPAAWRRFADRVKRSLASDPEPVPLLSVRGALVCGYPFSACPAGGTVCAWAAHGAAAGR